MIKVAETSAKAKAEARLGTVVSGRYRLVEVLAMGGVGVVYKGEHVHMHKWVAIKLLHPDAQDAPDLVARFRREAVVGAHVQHPNVIAATDFGELEDGSFFLVLEFVRGATLREVISRGPMSARRAVRIGRQLAAALGAIHAIGIVHRDVTPRNIMLIEGERDAVKLIDFGLAKLDPERFAAEAPTLNESRITGTGAVFGTIAYLAPEVARGMDLVDARADLYALGIVLYEMLSGKHPFDTTDAVQLFKRHATAKPPPIAERAPGVTVPPAIEAVVMRLLEKSPDARYPDADALIAALDVAAEGAPQTSTSTPPPVMARDHELAFPGPSIPPPPTTSSYPPPPVNAPPFSLTVLTPPPPTATPTASPREWWPYIVAGFALLAAIAVAALWWGQLHPVAPPPPPSATPPAPGTVGATAPTQTSSAAPKADAAIQAPDPVTRAELRAAVAAHDFKRATVPFLALAERDPRAFHDPAIALATRDLAVAISAVPGDEAADRVFAALAEQTGADGIDILYEIIRTRGGSKASARAEALLQKSEVLARGTPALQVTWALRQALCPDKLTLLDKAASEGDARTLREMETAGKTCFPRNQALLDAMKSLRQRLSQAPAP